MGQRKMHENQLYGHYLEDNIRYTFSHCEEICLHIQVSESKNRALGEGVKYTRVFANKTKLTMLHKIDIKGS